MAPAAVKTRARPQDPLGDQASALAVVAGDQRCAAPETARISSSRGVQGPLRVVQVSPSSAQKSARPAKKVRYLLPNTGRGYQDLRDTL